MPALWESSRSTQKSALPKSNILDLGITEILNVYVSYRDKTVEIR